MICTRCHKNEVESEKSRCTSCLEYARKWQKNKTRERRKLGRCITCGAETPVMEKSSTIKGAKKVKIKVLSRCKTCTGNKSEAYFEKRQKIVADNKTLLVAV